MEVELNVNLIDAGHYNVHLKGDDYIVQSVLTIYIKQLLADLVDFKVAFNQGDDQT